FGWNVRMYIATLVECGYADHSLIWDSHPPIQPLTQSAYRQFVLTQEAVLALMEQDFELDQEEALTLTQESVNHGVKTFDSNEELEYEVTQRINRMMVKSLGHTNPSSPKRRASAKTAKIDDRMKVAISHEGGPSQIAKDVWIVMDVNR
ncbi:hypothetical protein PHLCEN_2v10179, partial [Hermanssonia centrifuga]